MAPVCKWLHPQIEASVPNSLLCHSGSGAWSWVGTAPGWWGGDRLPRGPGGPLTVLSFPPLGSQPTSTEDLVGVDLFQPQMFKEPLSKLAGQLRGHRGVGQTAP